MGNWINIWPENFPLPPRFICSSSSFFFRKDQFLGLNKKKDKHQFLIVIIYFLMPRAAEEQKCTRNAFQTRIVTIPETNNLFITSISKYQDKTPKCRFLNHSYTHSCCSRFSSVTTEDTDERNVFKGRVHPKIEIQVIIS